MHFAFLASRMEDTEAPTITALMLVDTSSKSLAGMVCQKDWTDKLITFVDATVARWGHTDVVLRGDAEPALTPILYGVKQRRFPHVTEGQRAPVGSHQSVGAVER